MKPTSPVRVHEYLEESLRTEFCFARRDHCDILPVSPWKRNDCHVLSLVLHGGSVKTWFENAPGKAMVRKPQEVCLLLADVKRKVLLVSDGQDHWLDLLALGFRAKVFGQIDVLSFYELPLIFGPAESEKLATVMAWLPALEQDQAMPVLNRVVMRKRACLEVLQIILGASRMKEDAFRRLMQFDLIRPAIDLISRNYVEKLTIDRLARSCCLSRSQFHHVFKQSIGQSPYDYQMFLRLQEAKRLLSNDSISVANVGQAVGWPDPFHFSRIFKKYSGDSPLAFRTACRHLHGDPPWI